jgi:peptide chain release factor 1
MEEAMFNRLETMKRRLGEINQELETSEVLNDLDNFKKISKEKSNLEPVIEVFDKYLHIETEHKDALALIETESDPEMVEYARHLVTDTTKQMDEITEQLKNLLVPSDPNDDKNIIVEIRGAVGGDEANIFAGDLFRMYFKYAETQGWKIQVIDESPSGAGGYSLISFMVKGKKVYSKLKFESGAHRVQRVPKTEANGRIHTSTATVLVMPEVEDVEVEIRPEDLHVDTYRSQGAGGQNVNKTESAVRITHMPTGIVVSCQTEKSQIQNREICMRMLRAKILAAKQAEQDEKIENERRLKVGTGERSEKIRTYNYPQNRVTDHRIGFTIQKLDRVMEGELDEIIDALHHYDVQQQIIAEEQHDSK